MDSSLYTRVEKSVSWGERRGRKPAKASKDTTVSRQGHGLCILGDPRNCSLHVFNVFNSDFLSLSRIGFLFFPFSTAICLVSSAQRRRIRISTRNGNVDNERSFFTLATTLWWHRCKVEVLRLILKEGAKYMRLCAWLCASVSSCVK